MGTAARTVRSACVVLTLGLLALAPVARAQPSPSATAGHPAIVDTLLARAKFWRAQKDFAYAQRELDRAKLVAPDDPDVLYALADLAALTGDVQAEAAYRQRLLRMGPADARVQALGAEHALTPADEATLSAARARAGAGRTADALAAYQTLFRNGAPPAEIAIEYYLLLGSTADGFDQAVQKLGAMADAAPADAQLKFAFARLETLQEDTRIDGLRRLAQLTAVPDVAGAARQAWREALLWQGPTEKTRPLLQEYVRKYGTDTDLDAKIKEYEQTLPDPKTLAMIRGYNLMHTDPAAAEQQFRMALADDPANVDAMFMLVTLLRQAGRPAEAEVMLNRAITAAPARRDELIKLAGGAYTGDVNSDDLVQVATLTAAGRYSDAQQLLAARIASHPTAPLLVQLADIQRRTGNLDVAAETLNRARALDPANGDAVCTLAEVMAAKNRSRDAAALLDDARTLYTKANSAAGLRRVAADRSALQRAQRGQPYRQQAAVTGPLVASERPSAN
jgi:tetratricopeptide (TPR) repeat protein